MSDRSDAQTEINQRRDRVREKGHDLYALTRELTHSWEDLTLLSGYPIYVISTILIQKKEKE